MSYVDCYVRLKSSNKWKFAYEVGNSWQGCIHLWNLLEKNICRLMSVLVRIITRHKQSECFYN